MSINVKTSTISQKTETANVETRLCRHCDFQNGAPVITYPVEITHGETNWLVDADGNTIGLKSSTPENVSTFVLKDQAYMDFATTKVTFEGTEMAVGQLLPILIDRAIQAHLAE